jgi:hypothetical protein
MYTVSKEGSQNQIQVWSESRVYFMTQQKLKPTSFKFPKYSLFYEQIVSFFLNFSIDITNIRTKIKISYINIS